CGRCLEYVAALAQSMTSQRSYVTDSRTTEQDATPVERPALARPSAPVEAAMFRGTERFRVLRRLAAGGMGVVYEAYDREHGTRIAIKVLPALAPDGLLRFKNEFRALQDLEHPNLLRMGELFVCDGQWFFTMELVEGTDCLHYIRTAPVVS